MDFAATASGGSAGASALISVFLDSVLRGRPLDDALAAKRVHDSGAPDTVLYEDGTDEAVVAGLSQRGHAVQQSGPLGQVNALWCPRGTAESLRQLPGAQRSARQRSRRHPGELGPWR